jgi:hypothetical protein
MMRIPSQKNGHILRNDGEKSVVELNGLTSGSKGYRTAGYNISPPLRGGPSILKTEGDEGEGVNLECTMQSLEEFFD